MYAAFEDSYCYPGTNILRNRLDIRTNDQLAAFEEEIVKQRAEEPLPKGTPSVPQYRAIHRHLFQDVYSWAGHFRTVRVAKGDSIFAYPEHITAGMRGLFAWLRQRNGLVRLSQEAFVTDAAHLLAELNALHPFRDGNGRTQLTFLALLATRANHPLHLERLEPTRFLAAMVASFSGDERLLADELRGLIT